MTELRLRFGDDAVLLHEPDRINHQTRKGLPRSTLLPSSRSGIFCECCQADRASVRAHDSSGRSHKMHRATESPQGYRAGFRYQSASLHIRLCPVRPPAQMATILPRPLVEGIRRAKHRYRAIFLGSANSIRVGRSVGPTARLQFPPRQQNLGLQHRTIERTSGLNKPLRPHFASEEAPNVQAHNRRTLRLWLAQKATG